MVRNYIRKTNRQSWDQEAMKEAMNKVKEGSMTYREAADAYGVPKSTLERRLKNKVSTLGEDEQHKHKFGGFERTFTDDIEIELSNYIKEMEARFYGVSIMDLRKISYDYCETNCIPNRFNEESKTAGKDFIYGFMRRNASLSLRKPQAFSLNRIFGLNRDSIQIYFENLKKVIEENNIRPNKIYNCDETGISPVHRPVKVLGKKGKRVVSSATSAERGVTTTILAAMSATGHYIPPMMIFKRVRMKDSLLNGTPSGTIGGCSKNGWITSELFEHFIEHFIVHSGCSKESKVLLILDGHKTHTKNISLIDHARDNGLIIVSLPPHTSNKLQPLDRSFFGPFKAAYNRYCCSFMKENPNRRITTDDIGFLFGKAYLQTATPSIAESGFRNSGIVPLNENIVPDEELAEHVYGQQEFCGDNDTDSDQQEIHGDNNTDSEQAACSLSNETELAGETTNQANNSVPSSLPTETQQNPKPQSAAQIPRPKLQKSQNRPSKTRKSFSDIQPIPKKPSPKIRRGEESEVITSSPYKRKLEASKCASKSGKSSANNKKPCLSKKNPEKSKQKKQKQRMDIDDCECFVCGAWWHESKEGEEWIKCPTCLFWVNKDCCSLVRGQFVCDLC